MSDTATAEAPTNVAQLPAVAQRRPTEIRVVQDPIAVLDTARFEHMQRIATVMAQSALIPESLSMTGKGDDKIELAPGRIVANCFLVVNQAVRWNMDPFAVAQCVSIVKGRLCYEGKLIAAIIDAKLGIRLRYKWNDDKGDKLGITVLGQFPDEGEPRTVDGTVGEWKTTHTGSPWTPNQSRKMLAYRGAREWCRIHAPGLMLGVYSDDEMADMADDARANRAREVSPPSPPSVPRIEAPAMQPETGERREVWADPQPDTAQHPAPPPVPPAAPPSPPPAAKQTAQLDPAVDPESPAFLNRHGKPEPATIEATATDVFDGADWLKGLEGAFSGCEDLASLFEQQQRLMTPNLERALPPDRKRAMAILREHYTRLNIESDMDAG